MPEAQYIGGRSSIKVAKTAKGNYTWEIKLYFDDNDKEKAVINKIEDIDRTLESKFGGR